MPTHTVGAFQEYPHVLDASYDPRCKNYKSSEQMYPFRIVLIGPNLEFSEKSLLYPKCCLFLHLQNKMSF